jgi:hypothetical protein
MGARTSLFFVKEVIEREGSRMRNWDHYCDKYDIYTYSRLSPGTIPKNVLIKVIRWREPEGCIFLYYNPGKAVEDEREFNRHIIMISLFIFAASGHSKIGEVAWRKCMAF